MLVVAGRGVRGDRGYRARASHPIAPATDPQVDIGVAETDIAGLVQGGLVVVGQPGQAGHGQVVVILLDRVGRGPARPAAPPAGSGRRGRRGDDMPETLPAGAGGREG